MTSVRPPVPLGPSWRWTILIPVKATSRGKSRLDVPDRLRPPLALAMAMDTVAAAARCGRVLALVEDESDAAALATIEGVDIHLSAVDGLNQAILDGAALVAGAAVSDVTEFVAVLPADLPGLDPGELAAALRECGRHRFAVVPDHLGVGTTLLTATELGALQPCYGVDSFSRHQRAGAAPIDLPPGSTLRWDVDTVDDLLVAAGPRSAIAMQAIMGGRAHGTDSVRAHSITAGRDHGAGVGVTVDACTEDS